MLQRFLGGVSAEALPVGRQLAGRGPISRIQYGIAINTMNQSSPVPGDQLRNKATRFSRATLAMVAVATA